MNPYQTPAQVAARVVTSYFSAVTMFYTMLPTAAPHLP